MALKCFFSCLTFLRVELSTMSLQNKGAAATWSSVSTGVSGGLSEIIITGPSKYARSLTQNNQLKWYERRLSPLKWTNNCKCCQNMAQPCVSDCECVFVFVFTFKMFSTLKWWGPSTWLKANASFRAPSHKSCACPPLLLPFFSFYNVFFPLIEDFTSRAMQKKVWRKLVETWRIEAARTWKNIHGRIFRRRKVQIAYVHMEVRKCVCMLRKCAQLCVWGRTSKKVRSTRDPAGGSKLRENGDAREAALSKQTPSHSWIFITYIYCRYVHPHLSSDWVLCLSDVDTAQSNTQTHTHTLYMDSTTKVRHGFFFFCFTNAQCTNGIMNDNWCICTILI